VSEKPDSETPRNTAGEKRREAILEAAYTLFMEKGYAAVSLDDIIRISRGSKSSVYKYFGNKKGILKAVTRALADEMLDEINLSFPAGRTPREALNRIGMVLVDMALSEKAINQHRHAVSHARQLPGLARLWYESGPRQTFDGIARYLEQEAAAGRLQIANPGQAALLFAGMIIFHENMRLLVNLRPTKRSDLQQMVTEAVEVFLAAYGTGTG
jgi:AcrR family transcriptional regulator